MERYLKLCKDYRIVTDIKRLNKDLFLKIHPDITGEDYDALTLVLSGKHKDLRVLPVKFYMSKSGFCEDCFKGVINDRYYIRQQRQNRGWSSGLLPRKSLRQKLRWQKTFTYLCSTMAGLSTKKLSSDVMPMFRIELNLERLFAPISSSGNKGANFFLKVFALQALLFYLCNSI